MMRCALSWSSYSVDERLDRERERRPALVVRPVEVGAGLNQNLHRFFIAALYGVHEGRTLIAVAVEIDSYKRYDEKGVQREQSFEG